jgi:hypothetical protein
MCEKKNDAAEARHVTGQIVEVHYVPHCSVCVCVCVCVCHDETSHFAESMLL